MAGKPSRMSIGVPSSEVPLSGESPAAGLSQDICVLLASSILARSLTGYASCGLSGGNLVSERLFVSIQ
jgi:hypothetical protein